MRTSSPSGGSTSGTRPTSRVARTRAAMSRQRRQCSVCRLAPAWVSSSSSSYRKSSQILSNFSQSTAPRSAESPRVFLESGQHALQSIESVAEPRLHGVLRRVGDLGDVAQRKVSDLLEQEHRPLIVGQLV